MALNMYVQRLLNGASSSPNDFYRNLEQAFISKQFDNTTSVRCIQEQNVINGDYTSFTFSNVRAWVASIVAQSSSGAKTGFDFVRLIFEDNNHPRYKGRYYIIDNEYYISYFDNRVVDIDSNLSIRKCNQWMKIVDPQNGSIYQIPAVVDYDMSAPSNKVSNDIITPNNHAVVKVQQNPTTNRLFKLNARFILGGRPFKITGIQNTINQFINNNSASLMELDLFLDEIWEQDNLEDGIAYNGTYNYQLNIGDGMELANGASGQLHSVVLLNGIEVDDKEITWESSDDTVVTVNSNGVYEVVGSVGDIATITASLVGNEEVNDSIAIEVVSDSVLEAEVIINPLFSVIREYESIEFEVKALYNGVITIPDNVSLTISSNVANCLSYSQLNNIFTLSCLKRSSSIAELTFTVSSDNPSFGASKTVNVKLTSLLG